MKPISTPLSHPFKLSRGLLLGASLGLGAWANPAPSVPQLLKGMNLGNCLEAPKEGDWGLTIQQDWFPQIKAAGFDHVRIPIRWSAHASPTPPYTLDSVFLQRVHQVIQQAKSQGLQVVVNMHHYEELFQQPDEHEARYLGLWSQIAQSLKPYSDSVLLEPLNEPNSQLTPQRWNTLLAKVTDTLRTYNPTKWIIVSPADWGGPAALAQLQVPADPKMLLTVHYYLPFQFTHQNAEWVAGSAAWAGTPWNGDWWDRKSVDTDLRGIALQAKRLGLGVWMGEFGSYSKAPQADRVRWTQYVARRMESLQIPWAYWEWASGFGIYNPTLKTLQQDLTQALVSADTSVLASGNAPQGTNLLQNGSFAQGSQYWSWGPWGGKGTISTTDGVLSTQVSDGGLNPWSIQLLQAGLQIQKGQRYGLIFRARSLAQMRSMDVTLQDSRESTGWKALGSTGSQLLDTNWNQFATAFYASDSSSQAQLVFNLGQSTTSVQIDDVQLIQLSDPVYTPNQSTGYQLRNNTLIWHQHKPAALTIQWQDAAGRTLGQRTEQLVPGPQALSLSAPNNTTLATFASVSIQGQKIGDWAISPAQP